MFPISDDNSDRVITPYVNYVIIGLNILVFLLFQQLGSNESFDYAYALVPREITTGVDISGVQTITDSAGQVLGQIPLYKSALPVYFNFLSSMFMHGDIGHIFGNMLFLWIFGDNYRESHRTRPLCDFLYHLRICRRTRSDRNGTRFDNPDVGSVRRNQRRSRRLYAFVSD